MTPLIRDIDHPCDSAGSSSAVIPQLRFPVRITLTLSDSVYKDLLQRAGEEGRSLSNLLAFLLENAVHKQEQPVIRDSHGREIMHKPSDAQDDYVSPLLYGTVNFNPLENDGIHIFGHGDLVFETAWSIGSSYAVHASADSSTIRSVAIAFGVHQIREIDNAWQFVSTARNYDVNVGEILVWQNIAGFFLATKVLSIQKRFFRASRFIPSEVSVEYQVAVTPSNTFIN